MKGNRANGRSKGFVEVDTRALKEAFTDKTSLIPRYVALSIPFVMKNKMRPDDVCYITSIGLNDIIGVHLVLDLSYFLLDRLHLLLLLISTHHLLIHWTVKVLDGSHRNSKC
jgi:hypothetical protein